ncbi:nucleotidyltransferase domain-containing protein [Alicyclobacillus fastidiosus]|uniref:Nucleotidyltransferase domain-containing protein n=1 Tax=Alicyclobacillus fastidiosus TaxID=392011 RepID=A0ABV5AGN0_9BACL|nr:nucleotidyltransferase domain-containing protein [Alicyclobacillus fastidiosus]WEH07969.1 nucleotidyltransferase domain-containing protein [Alicyclobacillus fastidiosus]
MGVRVEGEPPYPTTKEELDNYCSNFIQSLRSHLGNRLISVHLCGSWARREAHPPESDTDLMVVIDKVDEHTSNALRQVWKDTDIGCANVVDLVEIKAEPTELMAMMSDCHTVLFGSDPFPMPSKERYAQNLADVASTIGLNARCQDYYNWESSERSTSNLKYLNGKVLKWALRNLVAMRTGNMPVTYRDLKEQLKDTDEGELLNWTENVSDDDYATTEKRLAIARRFSLFAEKWLKESASARSSAN